MDIDFIKIDTPLCSCYGKTMIGGRAENQDCMGAVKISHDDTMLTVCDGMGGARGGATASHLAVNAILTTAQSLGREYDGLAAVAEAGLAANRAVYDYALKEPALRGMGSTATIAIINEQAAFVAHAGDSRIYLVRDGKKVFRTFDHSRVFDLVKSKVLTEEAARTHPQSNIITRALGLIPELPFDTQKLGYRKGDKLMLCCDGIWGAMPEADLIKLLSADETPQRIVRSITSEVDRIGIEKGAHHDNLTVIVAEMNCDSQWQPSMLRNLFGRKN